MPETTDPTPLDLDAIERDWLKLCGACDAGLAMACTCPPGDHRAVMQRLVARVRELERIAAVNHGLYKSAERDATSAVHASGLGAGWTAVAGRCPACSGAGLFLGSGGHVTCSRRECPNPAAADDLMHGGPPAHVADQPEQPTVPDSPAGTCGLSAAECQGRWHPEWHIGARGPADTRPDSPAILGRALLDSEGDLWLEREPDRWQYGSLTPRSREAASQTYGPPTEVLLVSPTAGEVLLAALRFRAAKTAAALADPESASVVDLANDALNDAEDYLVDTVDALGDPQQPLRAGPEPTTEGAGSLGADQPAEPTPETLRCVTCSTPIVGHGGERYSHLMDGYDDYTGPHPARPSEPTPEPAAGEAAHWHFEAVRLRAELAEVTADRDRLERLTEADRETIAALRSERNEARADLEEAKRLHESDVSAWRAEAERLRAELADYKRLFDLQWRRMTAAAALWRAEAPAERELIQPDLGALLQWLMDRAATARRDAAADAWDRAVRYLDEFGSDTTAAAAVTMRGWIAEANAEIRAGTRPTPGSPEPAQTEGGRYA